MAVITGAAFEDLLTVVSIDGSARGAGDGGEGLEKAKGQKKAA